MIVKKSHYGLKSSGAAFHSHLTQTLIDTGYTSTHGDLDVWIRPTTKKDGFEYYEIMLVYIDDITVYLMILVPP